MKEHKVKIRSKKRKKQIALSLIGSLLLISSIGNVTYANEVLIEKTYNFSQSANQSQQQNITLDDLGEVKEIKVDDGTVSYSRTGRTVRLNLNYSSPDSTQYDAYKYSKNVTDYQTSSNQNGFSSSMTYSESSYRGTIYQSGSPYTVSGSAPESKWVTGQTSSYYNSGGYTGYLSSYVYSYTPGEILSKSVYDDGHYGTIISYWGCQNGSWDRQRTDYRVGGQWIKSYSDASGYSGTLYLRGSGGAPTPTGSCTGTTSSTIRTTQTSGGPWSFTGTVYKTLPSTPNYRYQGNVSTSDTRTWRQNYSGTVYKSGYDNLYQYVVTIKYLKDVTPPALQVVINNNNFSHELSVNVSATDSQSGVRKIRLPNGSVLSTESTSYTITQNGNYTFEVEDWAGNIETKTIQIKTIDNQNPNTPTIVGNEQWSNSPITVSIEDNGDNGVSGVGKKEYLLSGATIKGWTLLNDGLILSNEGTTIVNARVIDNAGNISNQDSLLVKIDKTAPSIEANITPSSWTINDGSINITTSDNLSGVKKIQLPNGNWISASTVNYVVNSNGDYTFLVEDNAGNVTTKTINVSTIDQDKPVGTHTIDHVDANTYKVTIKATDKSSGMKYIKLPNGEVSNGGTATYLVYKGESYSFELEDRVGNKSAYPVTVDIPELNVYQKDDHVKAEWAIEMMEEDVLIKTSFENSDTMMPSFPTKPAIQHQEGASYIEVNDSRNVEFRRYATGWVDKNYFEQGNGTPSLSQKVGEKYTYYYKLKDGRYRLEHNIYTNGVQEISSDESYEGSQSYKVGQTTPKLGNFFFFPSLYTGTSYGTFPKLYAIQNSMDLSLSFRAKTDATATIETVAHGGMSSWTYPFHERYGLSKPLTVATPASRGAKRIYINGIEQLNLHGVYYVTNRTSQTETIQHFYSRILTINKSEGYIELQSSLTEDWDTGYVLQSHVNRTPVNFQTRTIQNNDGWSLFNVNAKVADYHDYNSSILGLVLWFKTVSYGNTYIDDVKMGFATKAQLFRGNEKIYEGLLSDYEDREATDKAKPNPVDSIQVNAKSGKVFMKVQVPTDNGTDYEYTVKAVSNKGDLVSSEKKTATVTTGIDGYSYVVDTNPGTIPDNAVDTPSTDIEIPVTTNAKYYVHIKSIDKAGNVSDVKHLPFQDNVAPEVSVSQNPTTWTNSSVLLTATASDSGLDVKRVQLPNGTWVSGNTASQHVTTNGTYAFVVEDLVGNKTTKSITVTNIDKTAPTPPTISNNQEWTKVTPVIVMITAGTDSQSGFNRVEYRLEGATVKGWTAYTGSFEVVNEGETRVIARTVDNLGHFSTEDTSTVRIDQSSPYNIGITIKLKP